MKYQHIERVQDCSACKGSGHKTKTVLMGSQVVTLLENEECSNCDGTGKVDIERLAKKVIRDNIWAMFWFSIYICGFLVAYSFLWNDFISMLILLLSTYLVLLAYVFTLGGILVAIREQHLILSCLKESENYEILTSRLEEKDIFTQIDNFENSSFTTKPKSSLTIS